MSYRNDHDAALARVDALQLEVTQLRERATQTPAARIPSERRGLARLVAGRLLPALVAAGVVCLGMAFASDPEAAPGNDRIAAIDTRIDHFELDACIAAIQPAPVVVAHGVLSPEQVVQAQHSAAPCRSALGNIARSALWSPTQSTALDSWIAAEGELANSLGLITVYYGENPEAADHYVAAPQLWREYERAHARRDAAIAKWREAH